MRSFLERLLQLYDLSLDDYKELTKDVTLEDLEDPYNFKNISYAKECIFEAMKNNDKIMIYGDYDCDGITSTSILYYTFKKLNYSNVGYYIPSRYKDGYGINTSMVELIHSKGYKMIITVDNGVAQFEALAKAKELGISVILTDHHELQETIPECTTIVHPFLKEDEIKLPECGAYVAFNLSQVMLNEIDEYLLVLASLATISDMMPLRGYNRNIVRLGLDIAKKNSYPQFNLLMGNNFIQDEKSFSFVCAPKVNSLGRVLESNKVNKGVDFFISDNLSVIHDVYELIDYTNEKRKNISLQAFNKIDLSKYENDNFIIDRLDDVQEGLIGLIANKVLNEVNKPCVIFTKIPNTGLLKGSSRSLEGLPLVEIFSRLSHLIVQFGGHALAGGIAIKEENYEEFKRQLNVLAKEYHYSKKQKLIIECESIDFRLENYNILKSLGPYGEEFNEPYLSIKIKGSNIIKNNDKNMIKGSIGLYCNFVGFNVFENFKFDKEYTLIGKLDKDNFRGGDYLSFKVEEII